LDGAGLIAPVIPAPMAGGVPITFRDNKKAPQDPRSSRRWLLRPERLRLL